MRCRVRHISHIAGMRHLCRLRDRAGKVEGRAETTVSRVGRGSIDLYIHVVLRGDALCIIHLGGWRGINGGGGVATRASHAGRGRGAPPLYVDSDVCRAFVDGFNVVGEHIYV